MTKLLLAVALIAAMAVSSLAQGQGCEPHWSDQYAFGELNGSVFAAAVFDDGTGPALYAGGQLSDPVTSTSYYLAKLVNGHWSFIPGLDGAVYALTIDPTGHALYVGGNFTHVNGVSGCGVAKWDGAAWTSYGCGFSFYGLSFSIPLMSMAFYDSGSGPELYVGGSISCQGTTGLVKWNGQGWVPVGGGVTFAGGTWTVGVRSLLVYNDGSGSKLYVGGYFNRAGGLTALGIATWNGTSWANVGTGFNGQVFAMTAHNDGTGTRLYAAGAINSPGRHAGPTEVACWDGTTWTHSAVLTTFSGGGLAIASVDDGTGPALYASVGNGVEYSGQVRVMRNGIWSNVGPAFSPSGTSSRVSVLLGMPRGGGADLLALGYFSYSGMTPTPAAAAWTGDAWHSLTPVGQGLGMGMGAATIQPMNDGTGPALYAKVSDFPSGQAKLTATGWQDAGLSPGYAAGYDDGDGPAIYVLSTTGAFTKWRAGVSTVQMPCPAASGIMSLIRVDGTNYGGLYVVQGGTTNTLTLYRWKDGGWTQFPGTFAEVGYLALNVLKELDDGSGPALYAGGQFVTVDGVAAVNLARFNGTSWSALPGGDIGGGGSSAPAVTSITRFDRGNGPTLYVAGHFNTIGSITVNNVARWDGSSWHDLSGGIPNGAYVYGMSVFDDGSGPALYLAGGFNIGVPMPWKWDGTQWVTPADPAAGLSHSGSSVVTFVFDDGSGAGLYICGDGVVHAGPYLSQGIAKFIGCPFMCNADFNRDGDVGTDADIEDFFSCLAGNCCAACGSADFNGDGDTGTDADIESFFRVLAGGSC